MTEHTVSYLRFMDEKDMRIRAILLTSKDDEYAKFMDDIAVIPQIFSKEFATYCGYENKNTKIKRIEDGKTQEFEDLCFYFLNNSGSTQIPNSIIAVTEVTEQSSKHPILFPGEFLYTGTIGEVKDAKQYLKELAMLRNFPNEAILACKYNKFGENVDWIQALDPTNSILNMRLKTNKETSKKRNVPAISYLLEEKETNPYLRISTPHFKQLMETSDEEVILLKMKEFERMMKARAPQSNQTQDSAKPTQPN